MSRRAAVRVAAVVAAAAACPLALIGLLWALLLWSPAGLDALAAALLLLGAGWRCAWLHDKERTGTRTAHGHGTGN